MSFCIAPLLWATSFIAASFCAIVTRPCAATVTPAQTTPRPNVRTSAPERNRIQLLSSKDWSPYGGNFQATSLHANGTTRSLESPPAAGRRGRWICGNLFGSVLSVGTGYLLRDPGRRRDAETGLRVAFPVHAVALLARAAGVSCRHLRLHLIARLGGGHCIHRTLASCLCELDRIGLGPLR